ncbi:uncharacterized protein BT62DRAFT_915528 [Guyanagaster necrorhizus]|uniref:Uncharacterized protein n=1 Tax=Guyanagaster necrorhizus TaxID=856835 RepID=A0A9P7W626_9AGAR|nr:uncharacterized protein BT62DRAFT_915528 [Guyanagaster necrorhizus MCA 3950]KAG7453257.1 hypothetical protein BT62DRAFT_915528 [Guyanagaster necrorhizus MCA 3950]
MRHQSVTSDDGPEANVVGPPPLEEFEAQGCEFWGALEDAGEIMRKATKQAGIADVDGSEMVVLYSGNDPGRQCVGVMEVYKTWRKFKTVNNVDVWIRGGKIEAGKIWNATTYLRKHGYKIGNEAEISHGPAVGMGKEYLEECLELLILF